MLNYGHGFEGSFALITGRGENKSILKLEADTFLEEGDDGFADIVGFWMKNDAGNWLKMQLRLHSLIK